MEGEPRSKIKRQSEKGKQKSRKSKKASGFAMDFTYYSKALKAEQSKKKPLSGKPGSKLRNSNQNNLLRNFNKSRGNKEGKPQEFLKRHRRNMYSHNQITLQPMAFGAMKRGMASPKEAIRNAMTARSTQPGELKKVVEANKKSTVLSSGKHQYFIDSHMKKNRSPDVLRVKKKTDGDSRFKKKLALKNRKRRKTKTCTEGQLHRIKFQAEGMRQSKLKQSRVGIKSKLANFAPSGNKREGKGSRREVLKSSKVFKRKKTEETTRTLESQRGHKAPKKHFDLTIPIPNNESDEQEDTSRELAPEGVKGPYISCRNSRNASRQVSPKKNHQNQSKYRRELDKLEVNSRGSPLKRMEQTGFTLGSNYTSISSKNYKNDSTTPQNQKQSQKSGPKGYSHHRNFSYQYSHPLKNSSQFSQRLPKNIFQKGSLGDSGHQSYASMQSSNTFSGTSGLLRFEKKNNSKNRKKGNFQGHRKNLSSNFGYSPFLKNQKYFYFIFGGGEKPITSKKGENKHPICLPSFRRPDPFFEEQFE